MTLSDSDKNELVELQPKLTVMDNRIFGCFYLSASLGKKNTKYEGKIICYPWGCDEVKDVHHISDSFYLDIILDDKLYPVDVRETSGRVQKWKEEISPEFLHLYVDDRLCLGMRSDIEEKQKQRSYARFINLLLMEYFYYMCYVQKHEVEPWETYRHGMFYVLERMSGDAVSRLVKMECAHIVQFAITRSDKEWTGLLQKTQGKKIKGVHVCPFCRNGLRRAGECELHKKQIKGYNNLRDFMS